jgi:hypothetical protein
LNDALSLESTPQDIVIAEIQKESIETLASHFGKEYGHFNINKSPKTCDVERLEKFLSSDPSNPTAIGWKKRFMDFENQVDSEDMRSNKLQKKSQNSPKKIRKSKL